MRRVQPTNGGDFTATPAGGLDPTGLVKGWSIARVCQLLRDAGHRRFAVNGGGDVQTVGTPAVDALWRIGISDPADRARLVAVATGSDMAVATSGSAERGLHIVNPFTGTPADELAAVTVVGPDIVAADVYATAAVSMGRAAYQWLNALAGYGALVVDNEGAVWHSAGFSPYAASTR